MVSSFSDEFCLCPSQILRREGHRTFTKPQSSLIKTSTMKSLFIRKTSHKAASKYRAVNEEEGQEEEIPLRDFGFEVRDDFDPRSRALSYSSNSDPRRKKHDEEVKSSPDVSSVFQHGTKTPYATGSQKWSPKANAGFDCTTDHKYSSDHKQEIRTPRTDLTDEDNSSEVQSVTSLYFDDHSDYGNRGDGHQAIKHSSTDASLTSVLGSTRVMIQRTRSVESSFPEDPNQWLESASTADDTRSVGEKQDPAMAHSRRPRAESADTHSSAAHGDLLETYATEEGVSFVPRKISTVNRELELNHEERSEQIDTMTNSHKIGDPLSRDLWMSQDSNSLPSRNEMKVVTKLLWSASEDGTGNSIAFAQAVFPDDPFATNPAPSEPASTAEGGHSDSKEIPSQEKEMFSPDILWPETFRVQNIAEVENLIPEVHTTAELASPEPTVVGVDTDDLLPKFLASPTSESIQTHNNSNNNSKEEVNEEGVQLGESKSAGTNIVSGPHETQALVDMSISQIPRPDSDDSSGCYIEDKCDPAEKSVPPIMSGDEAALDDGNIKESSTASELRHIAVTQSFNHDPIALTGGCRNCMTLEEEIMILKAQHRTELLERDIQDEEILQSMTRMREYIENMELSDSFLPSSNSKESRVESDLEERLQQFDEEIRADKGTARESVPAAPTTLNDNGPQENKEGEYELRVQELEKTNKELVMAVHEAENVTKQEQELFKALLGSLQTENSRLLEELSKMQNELPARVDKGEDKGVPNEDSNEPGKNTTDDSLKSRIQELEEERDLLRTKMQSQEAAVALMTMEENELRHHVKILQEQLEIALVTSESTGPPYSKECETEKELIITKLRRELEESHTLRLSQGDTISKLVQQVEELSSRTGCLVDLDTPDVSKDLAEKIRALEAERNRWRAKSIVQQRAVAKMQQVPGALFMPSIGEREEFVAEEGFGKIEHFGSSSHDSQDSEDSIGIYKETHEDIDLLHRRRSSGSPIRSTGLLV
jgi:hypothetical protein